VAVAEQPLYRAAEQMGSVGVLLHQLDLLFADLSGIGHIGQKMVTPMARRSLFSFAQR
jgi:hypothetical protein